MKKRIIYFSVALLAVLALIMSGCTAPAGTSAQTGKIEIRVTDAPPDKEVTSIEVTVESVSIHLAGDASAEPETETEQEQEQEQDNGNGGNQNKNKNKNQTTAETTTTDTTTTDTTTTDTTTAAANDNGGWLPLALSGENTFDLLQIQGLEEVLATGDLAPGTYTQIRMEVTLVEIGFADGTTEIAKLPSGTLKFVHPFDIVAGETTVLLFDFDAAKSVNVTGNGKIIFKPVIKLSVTETPGQMEITTVSLPDGEVDEPYDTTLNAMGGQLPYTWSTEDAISGLALSSDGQLSGTPTTAGDYTIDVTVTDSSPSPKTATKSFTINIAAAGALQILTANLPDGTVGTAYSATLQAVGGTGVYTWFVSSVSLPDGLTFDGATGILSGTPTTADSYTLEVEVTDDADPANTDTRNITLNIVAAP